ncbi:MAG: YgiT-type zinc finger protein [Chloroflexi bacterium]|nr:YgiT-type zinc finger protein [Chloroflexota bacterium]
MTVTLEKGDATRVFESVPALVCDTCGEVYLEDEIGSHLLAKIQADEAQWDAQFAATDDGKLAELVAAVEAEINDGRTLPMFDAQGNFREYPASESNNR